MTPRGTGTGLSQIADCRAQRDQDGNEHLHTQSGVDAEATERSYRVKAIVRRGRA